MNTIKKFFFGLVAAAAALTGFTACQNDIDAPADVAPVAKLKPNTTIAEFKARFWQDAANYADTVGVKDNGDHYIIHGTVISTDEPGNVFKSLYIQDETGVISFSINSYNLYLNYRRGQEVVIDATGMYVGKYAGMMQFGAPSYYANGNTWQVGFMAPELFKPHVELNGMPNLADIDTVVCGSFAELSTTAEGLQRWQGQMVRFNNVSFTDGGKATFSVYKSNSNTDVNKTLTDSEGNSIIVRTSGYANFATKKLPEGSGDVIGILGFYESLAGKQDWQLTLLDIQGCQNFGNPTLTPGTEKLPWTVDQAIEIEAKGTVRAGWVGGYIVGAVAPEVTNVTKDSDIEWKANPTLNNTLVIGQTPETKDLAHAIVIELPYGSKLRDLGNLVSHPENYGKAITIKGSLDKVLGTYGVTGNSGAAGTWTIDGVDSGADTPKDGNGTLEAPYTCAQVIAMNPASGVTAASGVYVSGYVVGWANMATEFVINANTATFSVPATVNTNILVGPTADCTDYTKCIGIQLPAGAVRDGLNLVTNPGNLGKKIVLKGDVMKYSGLPGIKNTSEFTLEGGSTPGGDTPAGDVVTSIDQNFDAATTLPTGWTQKQVAGNKTWFIKTFSGQNYASMTGYNGTAPFDSWLLTPAIDIAKCADKKLTFDTQVNGYGSTTTQFEVYALNNADPSKATVKTKLNCTLATAPESGYSEWVSSGAVDLSAQSGTIYIGFRYVATQDANYATWCLDNVKLNAAGGETPGGGDTPVTDDYKGQFNSFNGGVAKSSPYGTYTNATGWTAENAIVLGGTDADADANPYFKFIGKAGVLAPTLNGKVGSCGRLISPVLTGGCGTLTFNYGFAFAETKAGFKVTVRDAAGNVVKEDEVKLDAIEKLKAYSYSLAVNCSGNFTIEIVNLAYSANTASNKDRVSIFNLTWTGM